MVNKSPKADKKLAGRPKLDIPADKVKHLAKLGASIREIGMFFGCDHKVIGNRFKNEIELGRGERLSKLRQWQWDSAEKGSVPMQIFLGKNELGQSDRQGIDVTSDGKPIKAFIGIDLDKA